MEKEIEYWRSLTKIEPGDSRELALEKFKVFMDNPTCNRCNGEKLKEFCNVRSICKEVREKEIHPNIEGVSINDGIEEKVPVEYYGNIQE